MPHRDGPSRSTQALLVALLGDPAGVLPDPGAVELGDFWTRFSSAAPLHLRLLMTIADVVIARVLPRAMGHRHGLAGLDAEASDRVVQAAGALPVVSLLAMATKVVACMGYFSDADVDAAMRGAR